MNTQQMKEDCEFCQQNGGVRLGVKIPEMLELIAAYEGAQFAAASHLRTVEQQAKIIAGMQAAPIQSGDVRNQALEEAAALCVALIEKHNVHSNFICANAIRALASTPSAAMQGQGRCCDRAESLAIPCAVHGFTPSPAAQPQAGGRELTDTIVAVAVARVLADRSADECNVDREDNWKFYSDDFMAEAKAAIDEYYRITGTKGAK